MWRQEGAYPNTPTPTAPNCYPRTRYGAAWLSRRGAVGGGGREARYLAIHGGLVLAQQVGLRCGGAVHGAACHEPWDDSFASCLA